MTAKTIARRQAEYYRRKLASGLKWVKVWVRPADAQALQDFARKLLEKS